MTLQRQALAPSVAALMALALACAAHPRDALAQHHGDSVGRSDRVTAEVRVKSVDPATRHLVVTTEDGEDLPLAAPPEVQNLAQLKPGDRIRATYYREVELVLSKGNAPLPKDASKLVTARAAKGEMPAAGAATQIVVTGAIVGIDQAAHILKVVSPQGGEVHVIQVKRADGRKAMAKLKVGDKITAYVTEGLLITARPG